MRQALALACLAGAALAAQAPDLITAARYLEHVKFLSADDLGGRANGTPGLERAADYIEGQFRAAGLVPGGDAGTFGQAFEVTSRVEPPASAALEIASATGSHDLALGSGYHPLSVRNRPRGAQPNGIRLQRLVFAGHGIAAPGLGYDDYAGVDVRDAAVVVLTHEPQELDPRSVFDGRNLTPGATVAAKAREARERGAGLLMIVEDPVHSDERAMRAFWWTDPRGEDFGLPVVRVSRTRLARALPGLNLEEAARTIDRTLQPQSRAFDDVRVAYTEHRADVHAGVRNIVGILPGSRADLAGNAIVVGAHYDHVGTGGRYSEAPEATGQIHNGADDNASGTAALIEVARAASAMRRRFGRTVVFIAFAGEEIGLLGSQHYVSHPARPLDRTTAMINLDMVGRPHGRVMVGTFGSGAGLTNLLARLRPWTRLTVSDFSVGGYAEDDSDHGPFVKRGVPAIAFFTGFHSQYHRPSDDWQAIDAEGAAAVARLALRLVEDLASR
jgi:hypothetical protein